MKNRAMAQPPSGSHKSLKDPLHIYFPGSGFVPKTYNGRISVFRVKGQPLNRIRGAALGWGRLAKGGVDVHIVPGKHGTVLKEANAPGLAEELKKCLVKDSDAEAANARR